MANLYTLEEAAKLLNVPLNKLKAMQENGEIFGYRDGSSWKFKHQELERVAGDLGVAFGSAGEQGSSGSESIEIEDDSMDLI